MNLVFQLILLIVNDNTKNVHTLEVNSHTCLLSSNILFRDEEFPQYEWRNKIILQKIPIMLQLIHIILNLQVLYQSFWSCQIVFFLTIHCLTCCITSIYITIQFYATRHLWNNHILKYCHPLGQSSPRLYLSPLRIYISMRWSSPKVTLIPIVFMYIAY